MLRAALPDCFATNRAGPQTASGCKGCTLLVASGRSQGRRMRKAVRTAHHGCTTCATKDPQLACLLRKLVRSVSLLKSDRLTEASRTCGNGSRQRCKLSALCCVHGSRVCCVHGSRQPAGVHTTFARAWVANRQFMYLAACQASKRHVAQRRVRGPQQHNPRHGSRSKPRRYTALTRHSSAMLLRGGCVAM